MAADELITIDEPLKIVAQSWGFTDISHLHKSFLKHYGCGPNEYRKKVNNNNFPL